MKTDPFVWRALALFAAVAVFYFTGFNWIEHRRHVKGGWEVTFARDGNAPCLVVAQPALHISGCKFRFPGGTATNTDLPKTIVFDAPDKTTIPFGKLIFSDLTFLPGTVTIKIFGHTVEFIPRVFGVDGKEHAWLSNSSINIEARAEKPAETETKRRY